MPKGFRYLVTAAALALSVGGASASNAAMTTIACTDTAYGACTFDGVTGFFAGKVARRSSVMDEFVFTATQAGQFLFDFTSNKINLSGVTFNGAAVGTAGSPTSGSTYSFDVTGPGKYDLILTAANKTASASTYSGTVDFTAAVPELATWAMMINGFGLIGGVMRRAYRKSGDSVAGVGQSFVSA